MKKLIEIDGRTGEGGGQVIRIATGLAALTTQPIKITNIRGNRPRGGGLKSQHVTSIQWLAEVTKAEVEGLSVGSRTLTFIPHLCPRELEQRNFNISAESGAASTLLILQAILPFCLFAAKETYEPITLSISGGTNVDFSLSYEYLDQVVLAVLGDHFGVVSDRTLEHRGWSLGSQGRGELTVKIFPISLGQKLHFQPNYDLWPSQLQQVEEIRVSIITPVFSHSALQSEISQHLAELFRNAYIKPDVKFEKVEDSGSVARWYILLVGITRACTRLGYDVLRSMPKKTKSEEAFISRLSQNVCKGLFDEVSVGGHVDEHLQDQLICFQALTDGESSLPGSDRPKDDDEAARLAEGVERLDVDEGRKRREKATGPFGHGSLHSQTARWVVSEMLPGVKFFNKGDIVKGIGFSV